MFILYWDVSVILDRSKAQILPNISCWFESSPSFSSLFCGLDGDGGGGGGGLDGRCLTVVSCISLTVVT